MSRHILCVEDDAAIRLILQAHFASRGFVCHVAGDGMAALDILMRGQIGVMVTDLAMPGMDGLALLRAVRTRGLFTRCVVVTGYATISNLTACLREGATALVPKPLDTFDLLDQAVDQAFEQMQRWAEQMHAIVSLRSPPADPLSALDPKAGHAG